MDYDDIEHLQANHPAWTLLRANNAPLALSFLGRVFIEGNAGDLPAALLASELDDELYALGQRLGADRFPKPAAAYLDDWAAPERGWLRKYYPPGNDEAHFALSPAVEKAWSFLGDLQPRDFIGTESRLNTIFELLRQMVHGSESDPDRRLVELFRQRADIDEQIARAQHGDVDVLDRVEQRDRYQQFAGTARELLADFREVEDNFRHLDRQLREQIAGWTGSKGDLLDDVLGNRRSISESDQGRSFQAFYDFLLSSARRAELADLLERLARIDVVDDQDARLARIHFDWIDASDRTQATVRLLSDQLRRFLDDKVWIENRRVFDLLRSIEGKALRLREYGTPPIEMELDDTHVPVVLPMERPLHRRARQTPLGGGTIEEGDGDFDSSVLLDQVYVDREVLIERVLAALGRRSQVTLEEVVASEPLEHGLAELVGYLSLREPGVNITIDEDGRVRIGWETEVQDIDRVATLPLVTFSRPDTEQR